MILFLLGICRDYGINRPALTYARLKPMCRSQNTNTTQRRTSNSYTYENHDYSFHHAADGTLFQEVTNGDEEPTRVTLPKGSYTIVADSDTSGEVSVPVAIEAGRTTVVHLEREKDWKGASARIRSADLVRLPNGQPIGFRARHAELLKGPMVRIAQSKHRPSLLEQ